MGQLLCRGIIHLAVIGAGDGAADFALRCEGDFEIDIIEHWTGVTQMWQQFKIACGRVAAKWIERGFGDDPRADRGRGGLGLKRPKRLIFPGLNIARRPVVQQNIAKNHLVGLI